ncbi:unnamed protein product [Durusdinium trenchii]|uniref:Uncharacterized protein n=2 Tax=Durusdinium trenchii TaxID=1381693 RepID=A0ABP0JZ47_9DINO
MTSHMKLPLPSRNFPRSTDTTPRSLRSPGGQSPCEAYFNGGMGLSPMSAYFEGPQPQHFFAPQPGPGPVAEPMPSEQPATSLESPTQAPKNTPNAQVNHNKMQMGVQHSMPFVTYPTTQGMPWPVSSQANISIPTTTGPTLLQGAAASVQKAAQAPQVPPKPVQQSRRVDTRSPSNRASCPAAVYVDLSSLREKK